MQRGHRDPETGEFVPTPEDTIVFVTAYEVSRHYGGPEEGGWWYDWYEPIRTVPTALADAETVRDFMKAEYEDRQQAPYDRFSVLGNGADLSVLVEDSPGQFTSTERPFYS